jgi:hypothetical protein
LSSCCLSTQQFSIRQSTTANSWRTSLELTLNAIRELREYLQGNRSGKAAKVLARLAVALANEREFPLSELYSLPLREFDMAMALMNDWRLDRYYASRIRLFDLIVNDVLSDEVSA